MRLHRALYFLPALVPFVLGGCDGQDPFRISVGFADDPPRPVVAGEPFSVRARGESDGTFDSVAILVFRGEAVLDPDRGLTGDTLAAVSLEVRPGASSFDVTTTVTVPVGAVSRPERGWMYIEHRNEGCATGCVGSTGTALELVPERPE
jgi:hypothetical protein